MKPENFNKANNITEFSQPIFFCLYLLMFITIEGFGQGSGCVNGPTLTLYGTGSSSCGLKSVTISGNTFGGSATLVTIKENGSGSVSPNTAYTSPFSFKYTPKDKDKGKNVIITVTTNNPSGGPCAAVVVTYTLAITSGLSAPHVSTITNPTCTSGGGSVELTDLPSYGTWTITSSPDGATTNGEGTRTTIKGLAAGTYTYKVTNINGCISASSANVVIRPPPAAILLFVRNPTPVCSPLKADLTSSAITAGSTPGLTFTYWTNAEATISYGTPSSAGEGTYYIKGTLGTQCSDIKPVIVTIYTFVEANAGTGGHICSDKFKLNAILTTGTGTWAKMSGPGNAVFTPDNNRPDANVEVDQVGTYDFSWTTGSNACASTDIIRVIFHDLPSIDISTGIDGTICKGENIQLHAEGTGFFSWAPPLLFNNPYISDPVAAPVTAETLTVTLTDQFGCKNSADIRVDVIDKPMADGGPDQALVSISGTTMEAVLYNVSDKGVWSLISGTGEFLDPTYEKTSLDGLSTGKNSFLWTVTNGVCPASVDTVLIIVGDMIIPTLITPNLDGRNDYFVIGESGAKGRLELIIFDRRGALVYKNLNYDNLWNGDDYNKNPLPEDTYFYVLKTANNKSNTGYIVIRR